MRGKTTLLGIVLLLCLSTMATGSGLAAADDLPRTFAGCVARGGDVRTVDGEVTCRLIESSDFRVYGTAKDECGVEVFIEIWGESRTGVVTWFLAPGRTIVLPEVGMSDVFPSDPIPCQDD